MDDGHPKLSMRALTKLLSMASPAACIEEPTAPPP
jgi:hypothetical protein